MERPDSGARSPDADPVSDLGHARRGESVDAGPPGRAARVSSRAARRGGQTIATEKTAVSALSWLMAVDGIVSVTVPRGPRPLAPKEAVQTLFGPAQVTYEARAFTDWK